MIALRAATASAAGLVLALAFTVLAACSAVGSWLLPVMLAVAAVLHVYARHHHPERRR